jgi:hypothetical protein
MSSGWPLGGFSATRSRSNVCPEIDPPATPSFYAFSYTVPSEKGTGRSFVCGGSGFLDSGIS